MRTMASTTDQVEDSRPDAVHEHRFLCAQCEYNLTGLTENRCPECGSPLSSRTLAGMLAGVAIAENSAFTET